MASGIHQVPINPIDAPKTAFSTPYHHLQYERMPMGLKGASSTSQSLMDKILSGLQGIEMFVYTDGVHAVSLTEHTDKMKKLLGRLKTAELTIQHVKCLFLRKEVLYLGHVISEKGVRPGPRKLQAVSAFPRPRTRKNVKQILRLAGYYRRFIKNFAKIAKPLNNLLRKGVPFIWGDIKERAFNTLREILYTALHCNIQILVNRLL